MLGRGLAVGGLVAAVLDQAEQDGGARLFRRGRLRQRIDDR